MKRKIYVAVIKLVSDTCSLMEIHQYARLYDPMSNSNQDIK